MQSHQNTSQKKIGLPVASLNAKPAWIAVSLLSTLYVTMFAFVFWGRNRGICITDEAFCLMLCRQPADFDCGLSCWHLIASKLPKISANIVSNFRLWHLIVQIFSASALGLAFTLVVKRFLHVDALKFLFLSVPLAGIASMLPFSFYPLALSYNSLVSLFVYLAVALVFIGISLTYKTDLDWKSSVLFVSAGLLLGLCFFVKATSAAAVFALTCLLILSLKKFKDSLIFCFLQGLGALLGVVLFFLIFIPLPVWLSNVMAGLATAKSGESGALGVVFQSITGSIAPLLVVFGRFLLVSACVYATALLVRSRPRMLLLSVSASAFLLLCAQVFWFKEFLAGGKSVSAFYVLSLTLCGFWLSGRPVFDRAPERAPARAGVAFVVFLALLPFCCAVGTGNNLFEHTANHLAPVFLLILLLSALIWQRRHTLFLSALCLSMLCLVAAWQFFSGYLYTPYGLALPMEFQTQPTSLPGIEGQKLCFGGRVFLEKINSLLVDAGFKQGDTILGFYNLPGVLLASCGTAPGMPAYFPEPSTNNMTANGLRKLKANERLFLLQTWTLPPEVLLELKQKGYDFPGKFKLLGSVTNPYGDPSMHRQYSDKRFLNCRVDVYMFDPRKKQ